MDTTEESKPDPPGTKASQLSRLTKLGATFAIYYCNLTLGVGLNFFSPSVEDFKKKFHTDVSHVSVVFTVVTSCYLAGALTYGILSKFIPRQMLVMTLQTCMAASLFIVPHVNSITIFFVLGGVLGFGSGVFDSFQIAYIIQIWRHEAAPYILEQNFTYSLGTIVPPLLLGPFLSEKEDDEVTTTTVTPGGGPNWLEDNSTEWSSTTLSPKSEPGSLVIPFSIAGSILALAVCVHVFLYFKLGHLNYGPEDENENEGVDPSSSPCDTDFGAETNEQVAIKHETPAPVSVETGALAKGTYSKWRTVGLVFLTCSILGFYSGMEMTTLQFIPTFAIHSKIQRSEEQGAQFLLALTLAFSSCRALGILIVQKIRPQFMIVGNFTLIALGNTILLFLAQDSVPWLWAACIILGAGLSTTFPSVFAYMERHLEVTDRVAAAAVISGGSVAAIYPLIVGNSVEWNPSILTYVNYFSIAVCVTAVSVTYYVTTVRWRKKV